MSFRRRLALSCGAAVAVVVVLGSVLAYFAVRNTLRAEIDDALRRTSGPIGEKLHYAGLELDPDGHTVARDGRGIELTRTEFLLLELLLRHPRQVLTRSQIFEHVWGYDFGPTSNSLEVYVGYLRRKLGEPRLIQTVRGVGYVLRAQ